MLMLVQRAAAARHGRKFQRLLAFFHHDTLVVTTYAFLISTSSEFL